MPELLDAPQYVIEMELRFPKLSPIIRYPKTTCPTSR